MTTFPQRLKQARKATARSQEDLAREIKVSHMTISKYERGVMVPEEDTLAKLARVLGKSPAWLKYGVDEKPTNAEPSPEFQTWLRTLAPDDLTIDERGRLQDLRFGPHETHPGPIFYAQTLALWRTYNIRPEDSMRGNRLTRELAKSSEAKKKKR